MNSRKKTDGGGLGPAGHLDPKISWMVETDRLVFWCSRELAVQAGDQLRHQAVPHKIYHWDGSNLVLRCDFPQPAAPVITGQGDFSCSFTPDVDEGWFPLVIMLLVISAMAAAILFFM